MWFKDEIEFTWEYFYKEEKKLGYIWKKKNIMKVHTRFWVFLKFQIQFQVVFGIFMAKHLFSKEVNIFPSIFFLE